MSKLQMEIRGDSPFIFLNIAGAENSVIECYTTFVDYMKCIDNLLTHKMPKLLEDAERLVNRADRVREDSKAEFEALGPLKKASAIVNFGLNVKELIKVPEMLKKETMALKDSIVEVKAAVEAIKNGGNKFGDDGKACVAAGLKKPVECNLKINGGIHYTSAMRSDWESYMKKRNVYFKPDSYHKQFQVDKMPPGE